MRENKNRRNIDEIMNSCMKVNSDSDSDFSSDSDSDLYSDTEFYDLLCRMFRSWYDNLNSFLKHISVRTRIVLEALSCVITHVK